MLVTDVFGFAVLISFWDQRSRSQQADNTISHTPMKSALMVV